jgi:DNA-binding response OmpR family regulator
MGTGNSDTHLVSLVLIVDADAASLPLLVRAAELEGLRPLIMSSAADARILATRFKQSVLMVLDISGSATDAATTRRRRLDAAAVPQIPAVVLSDRPLTDRERDMLRPIATVLKPLELAEAREIMRSGRSATHGQLTAY